MSSTSRPRDPRLVALRRFAISITAFNLLGYTVLGFEQPWLFALMAVGTAYALELGLELIEAWAQRRRPRFAGGPGNLAAFLLPPHITGLACNMLLYANARPWPVVFAVTVAIASKFVLRARVGSGVRHFMNPSNAGIVATLLLFPWVGIAPPYQFTEKIDGPLDWLVVLGIVASGTMLNAKLTRKMPLVAGWLAGFAAQALLRSALLGTPVVSGLAVMTGVAFVLFTNYMITDPATTPVRPSSQAAFGAASALVYGLLVVAHVVFGLFFALAIVCACRGLCLWLAVAVRALRHPAVAPRLAEVGVEVARR